MDYSNNVFGLHAHLENFGNTFTKMSNLVMHNNVFKTTLCNTWHGSKAKIQNKSVRMDDNMDFYVGPKKASLRESKRDRERESVHIKISRFLSYTEERDRNRNSACLKLANRSLKPDAIFLIISLIKHKL